MNHIVKWTVALALFFLPFGLACAQPLFIPTKDPLAGSRVFGSKGCVKCHAVNGAGGKVGPNLARVQRPRSVYDLAAAMWNHIPRMAKQMQQLDVTLPHLNPRETGDLLAFLVTLNYFGAAGDPQAGRQFFIERKCVVCHQVGGTGGVVGPNLDFLKQYGSPIFVATAMWNHGPAMTEMMQAKGIERPVFEASELLDMIAYFKSAATAPGGGALDLLPGRAFEGRWLFVEKHCDECHSLGGQEAGEGPDLAERGLQRSLIQFAVAMWNKEPAMLKAMETRKISTPRLKAQEMADLVAYLYSIKYFASSGNPHQGQKLVADKGCLGCHVVSGEEETVAGDFARMKGLDSPTIVISTLWNHSFKMQHDMEQRKLSWPQFSTEEMADLVAFLQAQGKIQ